MKLTLRIHRTTGWQDYPVEAPAEAYVLDALEAAGQQDPSLLFRHSCHHASCGSCGMLIAGRERLACITSLSQVVRAGRALRLEPLRNFPLLGDLLVDLSPMLQRIEASGQPATRATEGHPGTTRFENCIECGLCVSACPIAGSDTAYWGPAPLAAAARLVEEPRARDISRVLRMVDGEHGVWRCHAVFECTQVCPAQVDPARGIMQLRRVLLEGKGH